ncbi:serine--tRNA ligase [Wolbachia endosymbiont of Brugia malayi]|uniref:Serine--tRNA ligase n=1 Tax=Wolbachia sp. subsp. Brugia malayi (strain TRS) TaxID=292805 RepID=SYS_WOLTR|nr:serine--tRNA ligase [Wolbachia endosymbiont of Brugia malayi]Q5GSH2.1 RecName: Full=Serine--tRNA ligase; AltName: Full=Seryl-tRNA synthetase; Short=SerRS; AltName: Full=Seryl-tRNA(Ser/Sec) synthetase [Wolbachia endosymbiont strain TRS of Brugia malayi]AAW71052.1 Seryl-tRNA synthetase [Wolbachia endosymbiont strain TRS of Brugia malayi]QCB61997.1 serine--tRNA ligase [Wolbachia endosymbiont of Brugia malayi]
MHDIEYIRQNSEEFEKAMESRGMKEFSAEEILKVDHKKRLLTTKLQDLNRQRNEITKKIKELKMSKSPCEKQIKSSKNITNEIEAISLKEQMEKDKLVNILSNLPNIPVQGVPIGAGENSNLEVRRYREKRQFDFVPKSHYELGERLGLMDFEQAAKISGSRFAILKGQLAKLGRALINFMLEMHVNEFGYTEVYHPVLVKNEAMYNVGQLPKFSDDSYLTTDELRLIPTGEVVLTNSVADKIVEEKKLPIRFTAYSECFRKEAGSAGQSTRGMIRQHQFGKVELVSITTEDQSNDELERMTGVAEEILKRLELPYRVILLCSGDMGFAAQKTYDIEVWLPEQNRYREISSCSNCGNFQARRMNAKYSLEANKKVKKYVHTLNGSALAIGRTIIAVMENYQNPDGSITIPNVLQKYISNGTVISK